MYSVIRRANRRNSVIRRQIDVTQSYVYLPSDAYHRVSEGQIDVTQSYVYLPSEG